MPVQRGGGQRSVAAGGRNDPETRRPYRGVRRRSWGRYVSEIRLPGKNTRVWLGSFSSAESAARAHDAASLFLHGDPAALNFPDSAGSLPRPISASPAHIREAAARAADPPLRRSPGRVEPAVVAVDESSGAAGSGSWWVDAFEVDVDVDVDVKEAPLHSPVRLDVVWDDGCGVNFECCWLDEGLFPF